MSQREVSLYIIILILLWPRPQLEDMAAEGLPSDLASSSKHFLFLKKSEEKSRLSPRGKYSDIPQWRSLISETEK